MLSKIFSSSHSNVFCKNTSIGCISNDSLALLIKTGLLLFILLPAISSCEREVSSVHYSFDNIPDRIWVGEDFWTVPLEDWKVSNGRVECHSAIQKASLSVLTWPLSENNGEFEISFEMGLISEGENPGASGISIGVRDELDPDVRAAVYFGSGLNIGVNTEGFAFLGQQTQKLPEGFDFYFFSLKLSGRSVNGKSFVELFLLDNNGNEQLTMSEEVGSNLNGIVQFVNNFLTGSSAEDGPRFWFDNISLAGSKFTREEDNRFGPVLWTMHTLSRDTLKLSAQLPPLGESDNKEVSFQIKEGRGWRTLATGVIDNDARLALFRFEDWDSGKDVEYRVTHSYINSLGSEELDAYYGVIRKDPVNRPLRMGALTCQFHNGYPYSPLVQNLKRSNPDILYFSGDQLYEGNGGYWARRSPEDVAILSYLGKWYMFGWAFGDLMRDIPTICTPDDHDVFHGNLWGEGGVPFDNQEIINERDRINTSDLRGFAQTVGFVNMVNRTQCAHLPDPYDTTPIEQGMSVWYTSLNYGRVSFGIVSDRIFKSAPEKVSHWEGRHDHIQEPLKDPASIEKSGLEYLGQRQEMFLKYWIRDWDNVDMKVLLTQTVFGNIATHHGQYDAYLYGDMDSGGWPKKTRDRALRIIRKAFAFNISGDQHLPSIVQYGIDDYRDAGWSYCTPAIAVTYSRWFRPDDLDIPVKDRPAHGHPNTGKYEDSFGNKNYVYAIGNPGDFRRQGKSRYEFEQARSAGFGMVIFDRDTREITMESWRFLSDVKTPSENDQHPGWPFTISQFDNYGREAAAWLPTIEVKGEADPVVEIINQHTGEMVYVVRIRGTEFTPKVFSEDVFTIRVGYPERDEWREINNISAHLNKESESLTFEFR